MQLITTRSFSLHLILLVTVCLHVGCSVETQSTDSTSVSSDSGAATAVLGSDDKPKLAFVTNGVASFWTVAAAGAKKAGQDFNAEVSIQMPVDGASDQNIILQDLTTTKKVDGIAVSPVHPENQADVLNKVAKATRYITHDSDAPSTDRLAYIGMDNYLAGRMCGQAVKEAMPEGGDVMIFVGRLGQLNADLRRQGLIDELLDRSHDSSRHDPTGQVLKGDKYSILDTRTDDFDLGRAKAQAEDAIVANSSIGCMVGLFDYNPPAILEALRASNKLGQVKVVAFDERAETLQAIADGECFATVVQDPYNYGYKSIELLAKLSRGDQSVLPTNEGKFIDIPARVIGKAEVGEFSANLKALLGD